MSGNEYSLELSAEDLNMAAEELILFQNSIISSRDNGLQTAQSKKLN